MGALDNGSSADNNSTDDNRALGSACSNAISDTFLPLGLGELSGVCNISLKAVKIKITPCNKIYDLADKD